ncbi:hypothetical protein J437_LFUL009149 [Ladona fulva]|uniref:Immunoglobulin I-set domain-containing protein n=1 Tax=Ladona fulva TaxID=123851 RepID=A0A8K0KGS8_LADFU|nr:hypothetical protein J437_LFUL009149 [Ladona fulva]
MLKIRNVTSRDFTSYKCMAKNSLGETDGVIKLDEIPAPSTTTTTPVPLPPSVSSPHDKKKVPPLQLWLHSINSPRLYCKRMEKQYTGGPSKEEIMELD